MAAQKRNKKNGNHVLPYLGMVEDEVRKACSACYGLEPHLHVCWSKFNFWLAKSSCKPSFDPASCRLQQGLILLSTSSCKPQSDVVSCMLEESEIH